MATTKKTTTKKGGKSTAKKTSGSKTATSKTAKTSKNVKAVQAETKRSAEIKGILFVALGLFLALSFFTETTGPVGGFIKNLMMGLFGEASAIFFVFVIWTGLNMFVEEKKEKVTRKMWLLLAVMVVLSLLGALTQHEKILWNEKGLFATIGKLYGRQIGGVVGGLLCLLFKNTISVVGSYIVSITALLVLVVMMTEISLESVARKVFEPIRAKRTEMTEKKKRAFRAEPEKIRVETKAEHDRNPENMPNSGYFKEYFNGGVVEDLAKNKDVEQTVRTVKRFKFEEDPVDETQEIVQEILREQEEQEAEPEIKEKKKPFRIEDVQTGVLTELPDENGNFKEKKDGEFEPPSLVQMEEKVDVLTQSAIDAGVPLDRAVEVGKRMSQQEVQQAADSVNTMAKENIEATKLLNYKLPSVSLLAKPKPMTKSRGEIKQELEDKANKLLETLASFKVEAKILNITQGPSVTRFELQPGFGIKVSKITNLADDIALSLAASGVRIEAPIPGKSAIGIEIPNETPTPVPIREVIDTDKFRDFKSKTAFALGKDISGNCVIADVASFPHILIAGATGSGKSVCINSLITSILYKAKPDEVKMIMVDPKMVELGVYNGIPHLLIPVVTDPKHAAGALNWAVAEMKNRYQLMKDNKVRNIQGYNELMEDNETPENKLPEIVIIIDELADLMLAAKNEVEDAINSLAALARAAGMYLVIATQRPSVDVITGVIKANVPSRISFAVSSQVDSRTILDSMGAEKLLGKGDMLYAPRGANKPMRIQGNFLSDDEIEGIISYIKQQYEAEYDESILEHIEREQEMNEEHAEEVTQTRSGEKDSMFYQAAEYAVDAGQASVAMLQRRYKIGYQRAARIIDQLEENRIIGPYEGTKPRQVLITRAELNEMMMNNSD